MLSIQWRPKPISIKMKVVKKCEVFPFYQKSSTKGGRERDIGRDKARDSEERREKETLNTDY